MKQYFVQEAGAEGAEWFTWDTRYGWCGAELGERNGFTHLHEAMSFYKLRIEHNYKKPLRVICCQVIEDIICEHKFYTDQSESCTRK